MALRRRVRRGDTPGAAQLIGGRPGQKSLTEKCQVRIGAISLPCVMWLNH